jgi:N6-adenosine-specific RNA methylase IME4
MELNRDILRKLPLALRVEIEENAQRKPLTQSELATEQKRILHELRKYKAPGTRTDLKAGNATSEKPFSEVRATGIVGKLFNESHKQVERRFAVVDAAEAVPEEFGKFKVEMDRTGKVNGVFKRLKVAQQAAQIRAEPPPFPNKGPYRVIVADVPWPYEVRDEDPSHRAARPYPTMTLAQINTLGPKIQNLMHDDCIVWFWTTNYHMRFAFDALDAWGLQPRTILTWVKDRMGLGDWLRSQTEHCIMAIRGSPTVTLTNQTTVLHGPMRAHSQKPVEFYNFVESLCPASRFADIFSRYQHNDKWDCHGNDAPAAKGESSAALPEERDGDPSKTTSEGNAQPERADRA